MFEITYPNLPPIDSNFKWKSREVFIAPKDMETRHLFMTFVLIWNHTMPYDAMLEKSGNWTHHMYYLGPFYTKEYLATALVSIAPILFSRTDLEDSWKDTLKFMNEYVDKYMGRLLCQ